MAKMEEVTFYSRSCNLCISANKGRVLMQEGQAVRVDEKIIQFWDQGDGFGRFATDDPELIGFLNRRIEETGDVMTAMEYNRTSTPVEIRLAAKDRELEEANRLIRDLNARLAEKGQQDDPPTKRDILRPPIKAAP